MDDRFLICICAVSLVIGRDPTFTVTNLPVVEYKFSMDALAMDALNNDAFRTDKLVNDALFADKFSHDTFVAETL